MESHERPRVADRVRARPRVSERASHRATAQRTTQLRTVGWFAIPGAVIALIAAVAGGSDGGQSLDTVSDHSVAAAVEGEDPAAIDWDGLRRQVESTCTHGHTTMPLEQALARSKGGPTVEVDRLREAARRHLLRLARGGSNLHCAESAVRVFNRVFSPDEALSAALAERTRTQREAAPSQGVGRAKTLFQQWFAGAFGSEFALTLEPAGGRVDVLIDWSPPMHVLKTEDSAESVVIKEVWRTIFKVLEGIEASKLRAGRIKVRAKAMRRTYVFRSMSCARSLTDAARREDEAAIKEALSKCFEVKAI